MAQGVVKSYDPNSGTGIVLLDTDKTEVYLHPGSLKDSIFRTLRQGQRINFDIENMLEINDVVVVFPWEPATTIFLIKETMWPSISPLP